VYIAEIFEKNSYPIGVDLCAIIFSKKVKSMPPVGRCVCRMGGCFAALFSKKNTQHMKNILALGLLAGLIFGLNQCTNINSGQPQSAQASASTAPTELRLSPVANADNYWFQGKAELATYRVEQERYGQMRDAEQVMIFVSEELSKRKQVKLDNPDSAPDDRCMVLKINTLRRFTTGIYDYALMQSVFTPMDGTPTLKTTTSVQDWCGHVFTQINLVGSEGYRVRDLSYFEADGDTDLKLRPALLEDELWNRMRLDPTRIPTGEQSLIPAAFYSRLRHKPHAVQPATLALSTEGNERTLRVQYKNIDRQLRITCEAAAPHRLLRWEERDNGKLSSKGTLTALRLEPYWQQNSHEFDGMRDSLKLR
jgi:hypothetical protein